MPTTPEQEHMDRAIRTFDKLIPSLNSFASALTGSNVTVKMGANTLTDGKTIWITPPLSLGDEYPHERTLCGRRGKDDRMMCKACEQRETVVTLIYHEMSHLIFGSFDDFSIREFEVHIDHAGLTPHALAKVREKIESVRKRRDVSSIETAAVINPFLPNILRTVEDGRVDARMFRARSGTMDMRRGMVRITAAGGFHRIDGSTVDWSELSLNSQLPIAMFLSRLDKDFLSAFDPYVAQSATDERLLVLVDAADNASSVTESTAISVAILERAQQLGFFETDDPEQSLVEPEPEPEREPEDESKPEEESEGDNEDESPDDAGKGEDQDEPEEGSDEDQEESVQPEGGESDQDSDGEPDESDDPSGGDGGDESSEPDGDPSEAGDEDASGSGTDLDESTDQDADEDADGSGDDPGEGESSDVGDPSPGLLGEAEGDASSDSDGEVDAGQGEGSAEPSGDSSGDADATGERSVNGSPEIGRPEVDFGTPEEMKEAVDQLLGHKEDETRPAEEGVPIQDLREALETFEHFENPSAEIRRVRVVDETPSFGTKQRTLKATVSESMLGPNLLRMRRMLTDNARSEHQRNKRSGRVSSRVLGRRAWNDDDRLFTKKVLPTKKDYAILIGIDTSYSTTRPVSRRGSRKSLFDLEVEAAYAQAELCHRIGVKFAVYGHTGMCSTNLDSFDIFQIKSFAQRWDKDAMARFEAIHPQSANLDGHTLEYYRKRLDEVRATDKILMYYSDGAMPMENYVEELEILKREIEVCRKRNYTLMGVGVKSTDPIKYGMDTVRLDTLEDVRAVVDHLGKKIGAV